VQGVLVVDDSADDRLLLGTYLRSEGFSDVLNAESAQEAFHYLGMPTLVNTELIAGTGTPRWPPVVWKSRCSSALIPITAPVHSA
jgi:hypothetical protein